jgi:peptidoglycan/LPS O-acetylase OafA/YrhL
MIARSVPAVVGLTLFVALTELRMDDSWSAGVLFVFALVPAAFVLVLGLAASRGANAPRGPATVLLVTGLALVGIALVRFGQVLSGDDWSSHGGTLSLVLALFVLLAAWCHRRSGSVACLLLASLAAVGLLVEAVNWIFDTENVDVFRALLAASFLALFLAGLAAPNRRGTILVGAAGVTALATSLTFNAYFLLVPLGGEVGWGWELITLVEGLALLAYAAVELEPGPGYLALFTLLLFVLSAAALGNELDESDTVAASQSLIGWPLAIGIGTALAACWAVLGARRAE